MNLKKLKIILYLPLAIFFMASLFYYSQPVKAAINDSMPKLQVPIPELNFTPFDKIISECKEENGQKICNFPWIGEYIAGIYKYAIGIVGILAAVVLMIGGVMWIIAGGSATMIGEAKAWIGASLTGLVIALTSYLILYQINPALTVFPPLGIAQVEKIITKTDYCTWQLDECKGNQTAGAPESCGEKPGPYWNHCCCAVRVGKQSIACSQYIENNAVDYNSIPLEVRQSPPAACKKITSDLKLDFDSYDPLANILRALAATESSCNPQAESPAGSCGLMQLLPATAKIIYDSDAVDCQWLKNNPQKSIDIAFKFISDLKHTNVHENSPTRIFAGYNSGYSDKPYNCKTPNDISTCKKGGLAPSSDCPGKLAFECCINSGELAETQDHVLKSIKYLNWIKANDGF